MRMDHSNQDREKDKNKYEGITLMFFHAELCTPCDNQSAILDDLFERLNCQIKIVEIDIDDPESISEEYNINAVPTICLLKKGREVKRFIGVQPLDTLLDTIENFIKKNFREE
jgi:thioredoxin 1